MPEFNCNHDLFSHALFSLSEPEEFLYFYIFISTDMMIKIIIAQVFIKYFNSYINVFKLWFCLYTVFGQINSALWYHSIFWLHIVSSEYLKWLYVISTAAELFIFICTLHKHHIACFSKPLSSACIQNSRSVKVTLVWLWDEPWVCALNERLCWL